MQTTNLKKHFRCTRILTETLKILLVDSLMHYSFWSLVIFGFTLPRSCVSFFFWEINHLLLFLFTIFPHPKVWASTTALKMSVWLNMMAGVLYTTILFSLEAWLIALENFITTCGWSTMVFARAQVSHRMNQKRSEHLHMALCNTVTHQKHKKTIITEVWKQTCAVRNKLPLY